MHTIYHVSNTTQFPNFAEIALIAFNCCPIGTIKSQDANEIADSFTNLTYIRSLIFVLRVYINIYETKFIAKTTYTYADGHCCHACKEEVGTYCPVMGL